MLKKNDIKKWKQCLKKQNRRKLWPKFQEITTLLYYVHIICVYTHTHTHTHTLCAKDTNIQILKWYASFLSEQSSGTMGKWKYQKYYEVNINGCVGPHLNYTQSKDHCYDISWHLNVCVCVCVWVYMRLDIKLK